MIRLISNQKLRIVHTRGQILKAVFATRFGNICLYLNNFSFNSNFILTKQYISNIIYIDHCQFKKLDGQPVIRIIRNNRLCVKLGNTSTPTAIKVKYI